MHDFLGGWGVIGVDAWKEAYAVKGDLVSSEPYIRCQANDSRRWASPLRMNLESKESELSRIRRADGGCGLGAHMIRHR